MQIKKLFLIAVKDLRLLFRDSSALIFMLMAPFLLTLGMGALTGAFSAGEQTGIRDIAVLIVNADEGELGEALVAVYQSSELDDLVNPIVMDDFAEAQTMVDEDQGSGAIFVPAGFTTSIMSSNAQGTATDPPQIVFYGNPTEPTSAGVLRSILDQFVNQVQIGRVSAEVIVGQLLENGLIPPEQAPALGARIGQELASASPDSTSITVKNETAEGEPIQFNILAYLAPGMAVMFLMYTVTYGGRSLLAENFNGTLPRLLISPTFPAYVLVGKAVGILLTAVAQLLILIVGTSLMFRLQWGDFLGVILLIFAAAWGASGWGMLFAAILKTPGQVAVTGSAVMLLFGIMGGSFFDISMLPDWVQVVNKITPNAWAVDGFYILSVGGKINDILPNILALLIMGAILFAIATLWIRRHGLARK